MKIREEIKVGFDELVVFKNHFDFNGLQCNAIVQTEDGGLMFLNTDTYHTTAEVEEEIEKAVEEVYNRRKRGSKL